jgi:hypothetical protein
MIFALVTAMLLNVYRYCFEGFNLSLKMLHVRVIFNVAGVLVWTGHFVGSFS